VKKTQKGVIKSLNFTDASLDEPRISACGRLDGPWLKRAFTVVRQVNEVNVRGPSSEASVISHSNF